MRTKEFKIFLCLLVYNIIFQQTALFSMDFFRKVDNKYNIELEMNWIYSDTSLLPFYHEKYILPMDLKRLPTAYIQWDLPDTGQIYKHNKNLLIVDTKKEEIKLIEPQSRNIKWSISHNFKKYYGKIRAFYSIKYRYKNISDSLFIIIQDKGLFAYRFYDGNKSWQILPDSLCNFKYIPENYNIYKQFFVIVNIDVESGSKKKRKSIILVNGFKGDTLQYNLDSYKGATQKIYKEILNHLKIDPSKSELKGSFIDWAIQGDHNRYNIVDSFADNSIHLLSCNTGKELWNLSISKELQSTLQLYMASSISDNQYLCLHTEGLIRRMTSVFIIINKKNGQITNVFSLPNRPDSLYFIDNLLVCDQKKKIICLDWSKKGNIPRDSLSLESDFFQSIRDYFQKRPKGGHEPDSKLRAQEWLYRILPLVSDSYGKLIKDGSSEDIIKLAPLGRRLTVDNKKSILAPALRRILYLKPSITLAKAKVNLLEAFGHDFPAELVEEVTNDAIKWIDVLFDSTHMQCSNQCDRAYDFYSHFECPEKYPLYSVEYTRRFLEKTVAISGVLIPFEDSIYKNNKKLKKKKIKRHMSDEEAALLALLTC
ncbi:MAG: hypothetical protein P8078_08640 [bacterium]